MRKFVQFVITMTLIMCGLVAPDATATPRRVIKGKDGKNIAVEIDTGDRNLFAKCDNINASIMAGEKVDSTPVIMVFMAIKTNSRMHDTQHLFDVAKDSLRPEHTTRGMKMGCLTEHGGVGIIMPSTSPDTPPLYIQIDAKGRVFTGWDQAGLRLIIQKKK